MSFTINGAFGFARRLVLKFKICKYQIRIYTI